MFLAPMAILLSGSKLVWAMLGESYDEHLCENILNLGQKFKRCEKFLTFFSSGGNFGRGLCEDRTFV